MKNRRQDKILQLIQDQDVETQDELAELLNQAGFQVTQATISRDIRDLRLTKINLSAGKQKYIVLQEQGTERNERYIRVLREGFVSMEQAQNILVVNTVAGMAMAVAAAIDAMQIPGIVGCIAGDDTIMCAVRSAKETREVIEKIDQVLHGRGESLDI